MTFAEIVRRFSAHKNGKGYTAHCPAHDDNAPSLSLDEGKDGRTLMHCHAGCRIKDILSARGLVDNDLFLINDHREMPRFRSSDTRAIERQARATVAALAAHKRLPESYLRELGMRDGCNGVEIPLVDLEGKEIGVRTRPYVETAHPTFWDRNGARCAYHRGRETFDKAREQGAIVFVEGESDAATLWLYDIPAVGIPGATMTNHILPEYVEGVSRIYVVREPADSDKNDAGAVFQAGVQSQLTKIGFGGELLSLDLKATHNVKDPSDLHIALCEEYGSTAGLSPAFHDAWMHLINAAKSLQIQSVQLSRIPTTIALMTAEELLAEPDEIAQWLVDELLPDGGLSFVVAKPKVGKSTLAQNLAFCVSRGQKFLGRGTVKGPVIYLALEEKKSELKGHFRRMGMTGDDDIVFLCSRAPEGALEWLQREVQARKPVLIIIDTFQKFARLKDLNDYALVTNALDAIMQLARESGAHILLTHHTKKAGGQDGDGVLGSTGLFGGVDTLLEMKRRDGVRSLSSIQRYGADLQETVIALDSQTYRINSQGTKVEADRNRIRQNIFTYLEQADNFKQQSEIYYAVEGRRQSKITALTELVREGAVVERGDGKKGRPYLYATVKNDVRFLVPDTYMELENQNPRKDENPSNLGIFSNTRNVGIFDASDTEIAISGNRQFDQSTEVASRNIRVEI